MTRQFTGEAAGAVQTVRQDRIDHRAFENSVKRSGSADCVRFFRVPERATVSPSALQPRLASDYLTGVPVEHLRHGSMLEPLHQRSRRSTEPPPPRTLAARRRSLPRDPPLAARPRAGGSARRCWRKAVVLPTLPVGQHRVAG